MYSKLSLSNSLLYFLKKLINSMIKLSYALMVVFKKKLSDENKKLYLNSTLIFHSIRNRVSLQHIYSKLFYNEK